MLFRIPTITDCCLKISSNGMFSFLVLKKPWTRAGPGPPAADSLTTESVVTQQWTHKFMARGRPLSRPQSGHMAASIDWEGPIWEFVQGCVIRTMIHLDLFKASDFGKFP